MCFFGRAHSARLYIRDGWAVGLPLDQVVIEPQRKYFINVGSVGQPRDGDWRAAYALFYYDKRRVRLRRVDQNFFSNKTKKQESVVPPPIYLRLACSVHRTACFFLPTHS